jgi:acetyl-CoA C-acetyltransferase
MYGNLQKRVAIIGVGCTKFGSVLSTPEIKDKSFHDLICDAAFEAMDDAGIDGKDIDFFNIGSMLSHSSHLYSHNTQLADWLGLQLKPGIHFATACSTTNTGAGLAAMEVASGKCETALVAACDILSSEVTPEDPTKRTPLDPTTLWYWTDFGVDQAYGYHHAYDIATTYGGFPIQGYMKKYGLTFDQADEAMMAIHKAVRLHGSKNPKAFVQTTYEDEAKKAKMDEFEYWQKKVPFLAWPCRTLSALNTVDGASAYVITTLENAKKITKAEPIEITGFHHSASNYPWYGKDPTDWAIDKTAFAGAMKMAGITGKDIDYLSVHDCMQVYHLIESEIAGYFKPGEAWQAITEGRTTYKGDKPMNTSGGKHAKGHAFTASAGADFYEAVLQMRGKANGRQIPDVPETTVIHNHGYGMHAAVTVLRGC